MRFEYGDFWADLRERWTHGNAKAVRQAARREDGSFDEDAAIEAMVVEIVSAWSLGQVAATALDDMDDATFKALSDACSALVQGETDIPKASHLTSLSLSTAGVS